MPDPTRDAGPPGQGTGADGLTGRDDQPKRTPDRRLDQARTEVLADLALERGAPIIDRRLGLVAVPDTVLTEGFANGLPAPATVRLERADGRTVSLYRWPLASREVVR